MMLTTLRSRLRPVLAAAAVAAVPGLSGCYEHTVSATGFGADRAVIHDGGERVLGYPRVKTKSLPASSAATTTTGGSSR